MRGITSIRHYVNTSGNAFRELNVFSPLVGHHLQRELHNAREDTESVLHDCFSQNVSRFEIVVTRFTGRAQCEFVISGTLFAGASGIALSDCRANSIQRSVQLIRKTHGPWIARKFCHISPTDVRSGQSQLVGLHLPKSIFGNTLRNRCSPCFKCHHPPPIDVLTYSRIDVLT
jgi:hypothetical protein